MLRVPVFCVLQVEMVVVSFYMPKEVTRIERHN